jgi:hypothetical protein
MVKDDEIFKHDYGKYLESERERERERKKYIYL